MYHLIKSKLVPIGIGFLFTIIFTLTLFFTIPGLDPLISRLEGILYDNIVSLYLHKTPTQVRVVVVDIDEESIQNEGRWPWHRNKLADLVNKLKEAAVVVVAFDMVMSEPETNYALGLDEKLLQIKLPDTLKNLPTVLKQLAPYVDNDDELVQSFKDFDVVLGFLFHDLVDVKKSALPPPLTDSEGKPLVADQYNLHSFAGYNGIYEKFIAAASSHGGFVSNFPDTDGTVRHAMLLASFDNKIYPSLALQTVMRYLLAEKVEPVIYKKHGKNYFSGLKLDGTFIPTDDQARILIPFWGPPFTLDFYSATDVMRGKAGSKELEGAIVVLGSSLILLSDLHETPVAELFPGVEMVANLIAGMTAQQIPSQFYWNTLGGAAILVAAGIVFAFLFPFLGGFLVLTAAGIIILLLVGIAILFFAVKNMYLPVGTLLLLVATQSLFDYIYEFIQVRKQKKKINQLFGQYVPQDYVKTLIEFPENSIIEGKTAEMTALFSDIRGFTSISEKLDAAGVKRLLNTFFTPITEIIFNHKGTIDKYVGDMVVAFWGAPLEDKDHAFHALKASLTIFKELPAINAKMKANNLPEVNIGVGLGTGLMNVGDMGSEFRRAYTVLGDTVNLASRLQDLTKFYHVNILVNDLNRQNQEGILWRPVDKVAVKGRSTALIIYEPICLIEEGTLELVKEIEDYNLALQLYYDRKWKEAEKLLKQLQRQNPTIYLYEMYLERLKEFKKAIPPDDWEGVYIHTHK